MRRNVMIKYVPCTDTDRPTITRPVQIFIILFSLRPTQAAGLIFQSVLNIKQM